MCYSSETSWSELLGVKLSLKIELRLYFIPWFSEAYVFMSHSSFLMFVVSVSFLK